MIHERLELIEETLRRAETKDLTAVAVYTTHLRWLIDRLREAEHKHKVLVEELALWGSRLEKAEQERDAAQEHIANHLRDYIPTSDEAGDNPLTGDLAVDMAAYAGRLRERAEKAEAALARVKALVDEDDAFGDLVGTIAETLRGRPAALRDEGVIAIERCYASGSAQRVTRVVHERVRAALEEK